MTLDYNQLAAEYAQHRSIHPDVLKDLIEKPGLTTASTVLEVGCGTGNYITAITHAVQCDGFGSEPSFEMLEFARKRSQTITFSQASAETFDLGENKFDLVYSVDVIHHVVNRPEFFKRAFRALKPGGWLCTVTDSEDVIRRRVPLSSHFPETIAVELQRYPKMQDLTAYAAQAGFQKQRQDEVIRYYERTDIEAYRSKAFSSLHLISEDAFKQGITRLEKDLINGPIRCCSIYTLLWAQK